jgi:hypothetical protein
MDVIRDVADPVEREHYLQRLAAIVALPESALRQLLGRGRNRALPEQPAEPLEKPPASQPDVYLLALELLTASDQPAAAGLDLLSTEACAVAALFRSLPTDQRTEAGLAALAGQAEPDLRPTLEAVGRQLGKLLSLTPEEREREREVAGLKLRQRRLQLEHRQVLALLGDQTEPAGADAQPAALLARIAAQLREIEAALAARNGLGSLVWRSRQAGEVLHG